MLKRAGAASNASTSNDLTAFHTTFSKEDLPAILAMEADRFQHLKYSPEAFKTETGAVLGEYNKNSANPAEKLEEVLHDTAFDRHTYKHTTMGFLKDVQDMPNQYDYSLKFFDRYYRPEYTTIIVAGDVDAKQVRALVDKSFGGLEARHLSSRYSRRAQAARPARERMSIGRRPRCRCSPSLIKDRRTRIRKKIRPRWTCSRRWFSARIRSCIRSWWSSEQKLDSFGANAPSSVDPDLFTIDARLKHAEDLPAIRKEILDTVKRFQNELVAADKLEAVKKRERYGFTMRLDNSESVAQTVARLRGAAANARHHRPAVCAVRAR